MFEDTKHNGPNTLELSKLGWAPSHEEPDKTSSFLKLIFNYWVCNTFNFSLLHHVLSCQHFLKISSIKLTIIGPIVIVCLLFCKKLRRKKKKRERERDKRRFDRKLIGISPFIPAKVSWLIIESTYIIILQWTKGKLKPLFSYSLLLLLFIGC